MFAMIQSLSTSVTNDYRRIVTIPDLLHGNGNVMGDFVENLYAYTAGTSSNLVYKTVYPTNDNYTYVTQLAGIIDFLNAQYDFDFLH